MKQSIQHIVTYFKTITYLQCDEGCPWDRAQTVKSLLPHLQEELYEVFSAHTEGNDEHFAEELGDLCLVLFMILLRAEHEKRIVIPEVFEQANEKLIRRHPHVFNQKDSDGIDSPDRVKEQWDSIKRDQEKKPHIDAAASFHPFERSLRIQKQAAKFGFDWRNPAEVQEKMQEELNEVSDSQTPDEVQDELGDVLFVAVNLARKHNVSPTLALHQANEKFLKRFNWILDNIDEDNLPADPEKKRDFLDAMWERSKAQS